MGLRRGGSSPQTTVGVFLAQATRLAARPAVHYQRHGGWQDVSWIELREHALRIAGGLVTAGVDAGDPVLLLSENRVEWLACDLGIQMAGAATVPVHPDASPQTAQSIAGSSGAVLAIASGEDLAAKLHLTDALGRIVRLEGEVARWLRSRAEEGTYEEVGRRIAGLAPDDAATIAFDRGPAGTPRGVVLTHRNLVETALGCIEALDIGALDRELSFLSYAELPERLWGVLVPVAAGAAVWMARGVHLLDEDVQAARPTLMRCTLPVLEGIRHREQEESARRSGLRRAVVAWGLGVGLEHAVERHPGPRLRARRWLADRLVLSSMRRRIGGGRLRFFMCGWAPVRPGLEEFFLAVGVPVYRGWGPAEATSAATSNRPGAHRVGTAGRPLPGVDVRVAEDGEILVRGPGVMLGYLGDAGGTAEALRAGWLRTGETGALDEDGFLRVGAG